MLGKKVAEKNEPDKMPVYPIADMLSVLTTLTDEQWAGYAFYHEILERKISPEKRIEYQAKANQCGQIEAEKLLREYPEDSVSSIIKKLGFKLSFPDTPNGGGHVIFAQYVEPDQITVFMDCVNKASDIIREEGLEEYLTGFDLKEVLLAHELFHGIEYRNAKTIYTQTEKIDLWRKPFVNRSRIIALSEMAAMAFAKKLTKLTCSPYVLDVLLMYCYNPEAASALYDEIIEASGTKENAEC